MTKNAKKKIKHDYAAALGLHTYCRPKKRKRVRVPQQRLMYCSEDAAAMLAISPRKLWELQNRGEIVGVRFGRALRFPHAELVRFIEAESERVRR